MRFLRCHMLSSDSHSADQHRKLWKTQSHAAQKTSYREVRKLRRWNRCLLRFIYLYKCIQCIEKRIPVKSSSVLSRGIRGESKENVTPNSSSNVDVFEYRRESVQNSKPKKILVLLIVKILVSLNWFHCKEQQFVYIYQYFQAAVYLLYTVLYFRDNNKLKLLKIIFIKQP